MNTTYKIGGALFAALLVIAVAYEITPAAFADKNGAENPKDNNNGNPSSQSANPSVPAGTSPQPNPMRAQH